MKEKTIVAICGFGFMLVLFLCAVKYVFSEPNEEKFYLASTIISACFFVIYSVWFLSLENDPQSRNPEEQV